VRVNKKELLFIIPPPLNPLPPEEGSSDFYENINVGGLRLEAEPSVVGD
jgi:hypothetical protein